MGKLESLVGKQPRECEVNIAQNLMERARGTNHFLIYISLGVLLQENVFPAKSWASIKLVLENQTGELYKLHVFMGPHEAVQVQNL